MAGARPEQDRPALRQPQALTPIRVPDHKDTAGNRNTRNVRILVIRVAWWGAGLPAHPHSDAADEACSGSAGAPAAAAVAVSTHSNASATLPG
jgi:hypothetical protein